jgi:NADPH-dependent curcumin reductase CurA
MAVAAATNRQILLVETAKGKLGPEHFCLREAEIPLPNDGEVLLRVHYISLDAANRAWMQGATYRDAVQAGSVMAGGAVAEVVESKAAGFSPGDLVFTDTGWQDNAVLPAKRLLKLPKIQPMTHLLSVYGIAGLTAYFGLLRIASPREGETVVVSAAAGSVGSIVGQIAKIKGCRAIGIAGGPQKCDWLIKELGFDAAIDYKAGPLFKALKAAAQKGIDVYFDNVGGDIFETCLAQMNIGGRISCWGLVSAYDGPPPTAGPCRASSLSNASPSRASS